MFDILTPLEFLKILLFTFVTLFFKVNITTTLNDKYQRFARRNWKQSYCNEC